MKDVSIACSCGSLRAKLHVVKTHHGARLNCYCDDCQSFAHFLGKAAEILDAHGGTDIYQVSPAQFSITHGLGHLACMRLRPKGLLRWYSRCCNTPIGNTLATPKIPFVGIVTACIAREAGGPSLDALIGPPQSGVHGRYAKGDLGKVQAHKSAPISMIIGILGKTLWRRLRGDHKRSIFFNPHTKKPSVTPRVLEEQELSRVEGLRDASQ